MFTTLTSKTNSKTITPTTQTTTGQIEINDNENDYIQLQTNLATFLSTLSEATDLDMLMLNQIVAFVACNAFNTNQLAHLNLKRIGNSMAKLPSPKSAPVVDTNHSTSYFNFNSNDVITSTNEEIELEDDDEVYLYEEEITTNKPNTNSKYTINNKNNNNLNSKHLKESSVNRYYLSLNKQQQLINQKEKLNNCLAVDCNLPSFTSCLSSSSSTSSLSSSSSSSSSSKKSLINTNINNQLDSTQPIINTNSVSLTATTLLPDRTPKNTHLINRKLHLMNQKRKQSKSSSSIIPYLTSSKKYLSSSNDCLSSDEGYFGSYSDTSLNKLNKYDEINSNQQVAAASTTSTDKNNFIVLNIFNSKRDDDDEDKKLTELLTNELDNELDFLSLTSTRINDLSLITTKTCLECINLNQIKFNNECTYHHLELMQDFNVKCSNCCFDDDDLAQLVTQLSMKRIEKERELEIEMRSINWRQLLDQQSRLNHFRQELKNEDLIDLMAYLNEIEMNLDYFQADSTPTNDLFMDDLLKFKSNRMAFNLRKYHYEIEMQRLEKAQKQKLISRFGNIDSIPEFIPPPTSSTNQDEPINEYYLDMVDDLDQENDQEFVQNHDYDITYCEQLIEQELNQDEYFTNLNSNDYTLIDSTTTKNQSCSNNKNNNDFESPSSTTTTISEQTNPIIYDSELVSNQQDEYEYYYENEEDYELYEDQLLIDSLTEQEAITLLRNESELFALQMAQASKSGIILNSNKTNTQSKNKKSKSKKKNRFNSGTNTTDSETSNKEDIFENVFNYTESTNSNIDLIDEYSDNYYNDFEFHSDLLVYESTGQISVSLRNSLLKLRHKRRHLARLIENENKKPASTTSSSPSSSHLIKQMSRKPCVYMLNDGRCMRGDCRFAHDLKTITCKYWLEGECLKGDNCEFLHDHIPEDQQSKSLSSSYKSKHNTKEKNSTQIIKQDFKLDTEEFPALGGGLSSVSAKQHQQQQQKTMLASSPTTNKKDEKLVNLVTKQPVKTAASVLFSKLATNTSNNSSNTSITNSTNHKTAAVNIVSKTTSANQSKKTANKAMLLLSSSSSSSCSSLNLKNNSANANSSSITSSTKSNKTSRKSRGESKQKLVFLTTSSTNSKPTPLANQTKSSSLSKSRGDSTIRKK